MRRDYRIVAGITAILITGVAPAYGQVPACSPELERPAVPAHLAALPDSLARGGAEYWYWKHAYERETRGVGFLRVGGRVDGESVGWDWLVGVSVPLYDEPGDSRPQAWFHNGWFVPGDDQPPRPLTYGMTLETEYERSNLVVSEARGDGWIRLSTGSGADGDGAWTHGCLLGLGKVWLEPVLWRDMFLGPDAPPLSFVSQERHALRRAPGSESPLVTWLAHNDEVEIVAWEGAWARVRAFKPGRFWSMCTTGGDWDGEMLEGWVQWTDAASGTWLWFPTRGC